jgi:hypothetical protein
LVEHLSIVKQNSRIPQRYVLRCSEGDETNVPEGARLSVVANRAQGLRSVIDDETAGCRKNRAYRRNSRCIPVKMHHDRDLGSGRSSPNPFRLRHKSIGHVDVAKKRLALRRNHG